MSHDLDVIAAIIIGAFLVLAAIAVTLVRRIRRLRIDQNGSVARAREEFARDVHDLVGHWLWLASIKSELAYRRASSDPRLRGELAEALQAIMHAAHAVRDMTKARPDLSVLDEIVRTKSLLQTLGVRCSTHTAVGELPRALSDALSAVVREGVTNLLRHSTAKTCLIELTERDGHLRLHIANDGASRRAPSLPPGSGRDDAPNPPPSTPPAPGPNGTSGRAPSTPSGSGLNDTSGLEPSAPSDSGVDGTSGREASSGSGLSDSSGGEPSMSAGSGLGNLRRRIAALGGTVQATARPDGWFTLVVEVRGQIDE